MVEYEVDITVNVKRKFVAETNDEQDVDEEVLKWGLEFDTLYLDDEQVYQLLEGQGDSFKTMLINSIMPDVEEEYR